LHAAGESQYVLGWEIVLGTVWVREESECHPIAPPPPGFACLTVRVVSDIRVVQYAGEVSMKQAGAHSSVAVVQVTTAI
jgi:hypothetical protein